MAFLQDAELGLSQVQGRAARSVQGVHPGPWGEQAAVSMLSGGGGGRRERAALTSSQQRGDDGHVVGAGR